MKRLAGYLNEQQQKIYFPLEESGNFNEQQLKVIKETVEDNYDITNLADPNYTAEQMQVLYVALTNNIDLTKYVDYNTPADEMEDILGEMVSEMWNSCFKIAKLNKIASVNFSKEVAKLLTKELRQQNINVSKRGMMIDLLDYNAVIDCVAGKVYRHDEDKDRYVCDLGLFKNKEHLGDAYNCSVFNAKKIIKKLENNINDIEDTSEKIIESKRLIKADLNYPKSSYKWVSNRVEELKKENKNLSDSELYKLAWEEYKE